MDHAAPEEAEARLAQLAHGTDFLFLALEECPPCRAAEAALKIVETRDEGMRITKILFDYREHEHRKILRRIDVGTLPRLVGYNGEKPRHAILSVTDAVEPAIFADRIVGWINSNIRRARV